MGWAAPLMLFFWGALFGWESAMRGELPPRKLWILPLPIVFFGFGLIGFDQVSEHRDLGLIFTFLVDSLALVGTVPFALLLGFSVRGLLRKFLVQVRSSEAAAWPWLAWAAVAKALTLPILISMPTTVLAAAAAVVFAVRGKRPVPGALVALGCACCFIPLGLSYVRDRQLAADQVRIEALPPCFDLSDGSRGAYSLAAERVAGVAKARSAHVYTAVVDVYVTGAITVGDDVTRALESVKCKNGESSSLEDHMAFRVTVER